MRLYKEWASNCYCVSDMINGQRIEKRYYFYTKPEAIDEFIAYIRYVHLPSYKPSTIEDETLA